MMKTLIQILIKYQMMLTQRVYDCFCSGVTIQGGTDTPLGCIRIKRVIINSPAAAAGIIPNDILLSVDGRTSYFRLDLF